MKYTSRGQIKIHDQQLVNQISQNVFSAARGRKSSIWTFLYNIFFFLIGVGAYISRCLLRKNIGERTIGFFTIFLVYPFMWLVFAIYSVLPDLLRQEQIRSLLESYTLFEGTVYNRVYLVFMMLANPDIEGGTLYILLKEFAHHSIGLLPLNLRLLWYLTIVLSVIYIYRIYKRNRRREDFHSFYRGDSFLFESLEGKTLFKIKVNSVLIWLIVEPLFIIFLSYLIQFAMNWDVMALILRISAFCLVLEEYRVYSENRNMILDLRDSKIDAAYLTIIQSGDEFEPTSSSESHGRAIID